MLCRRHALHCGRAPSRHTGAVAARQPRGRHCACRRCASEPLLSVLWGRLLDRVAVSSLGPCRAGPSVRPARRPQPGAGVRRRRGLARPPCSIPRELGQAVPELCKDLGKRFSVRILCHDVKDKLWVPSWGHRVRMPASVLPSAWLARPAFVGGPRGSAPTSPRWADSPSTRLRPRQRGFLSSRSSLHGRHLLLPQQHVHQQLLGLQRGSELCVPLGREPLQR